MSGSLVIPGLLVKGKKLPVGHISTWADGNQYKKTAPGKWEPIAAPEPGAGGAAFTAIAREDAVLVEAWADVKRSLRDAPAKSPSAARRRITEALLAAGKKAGAPWDGDHWAIREVSESELVPIVPSVEHPGGWELQLPQGWAGALSTHQPSLFRPDISWQGEAFFRKLSEEMRVYEPSKTEEDARARVVAGILAWSGTGNSQGVWEPERARLTAARAPLITDSHGWYLGWPKAAPHPWETATVASTPVAAPAPPANVDEDEEDEEEPYDEDYSEGEWADDEGSPPEGWTPDRTGPDWSRLPAIAERLKEQKLERLSSRVAETYGRDQWESAVRFAVDRWTDGGQKAIRAAVDETDGKDGVFRDVMVALAASGDVHEELYRGTNWPLQRILDLAKDVAAGQTPEFEIRSPASFTSNYDASEWFANHNAQHLPVVIRVRNARGVYLGEMSEFGNEDEVVTAITKARVVDVETAGLGPALDAMITIEALEYAMAKSTRSADDLSRLLDEEFDLPLDHRKPKPRPKPGLRKGQLGSEKPGHLWHRREGSPGHYRYFYRDAQGKEFASDSATPPKKEQADIPEYKLQVEGKGAADVAGKMKTGIQQAADLCQTNPPLCKDNLGIPRSEMPQLTKDIQDHFLMALVKEGVKVESTSMPVGKMKATQREINAEKVNGMVSAVKAGKLNLDHGELVMSRDDYILDGHHRWAALTTMDPGKQVKVQRVDLPMHEMLARSLKHPGVTTAGFGSMNKSLVVLPGVPIAEPDPYPALIRPLTRPQRPEFPFVGTIELPPLPPIDIENPAGTIRQCGECAYPMHAHYGEFRHTEGADGDPVDVFVLQGCAWTGLGSHAWIVHAANPATGDYDEDKVILGSTGWMDERGIRDEFIRQYNGSERHFFAASRCTIEELATLLAHPHTKGEMLLPWNGEDGLAKGGSFPIGTVRTWKDGLKYRKLADGVWEALPGQGKPAASVTPALPAAAKPAKKLTTKQKASLKAKEAAAKAKTKKAKDALAAAKAKVQARKKALDAAKVRLAAKKKAYASAKKKKDAAKRAAAWEGVLSATAAHQAALAAHGAAKMGVLAKQEALAALTGKKASAPAGAAWSPPPAAAGGVPPGWGRVHTLAEQLQAADARVNGKPIGAEHIVKALKSWTGGAQKNIRQANSGVHVEHRAVLQKLVEHAGETGLTMLRGTRMPAHILSAMKPGHEISLRGLASFTTSGSTARSFAGTSTGAVILDLHGARGLKVHELSKYKTEYEVISSITKARVTGITPGPPTRIALQAVEGVMAKSDLDPIQQWFDDEFDKPAHRKPGPTPDPGGGVIPAVPVDPELAKGKRFSEGTVRTWSDGKQYRKVGAKWEPVEAHSGQQEPKERKTVRVTRTRKDGTEFVMHIRDKATIARVAHEKHERVIGLARQLPTILKNIREDASQGHQPSIAAWMIAETGMRVGGGKRDAPGKTGTTQTFGATTLRAQHIHVAADGAVSIRYQGKKAVSQHHDIEDRDLAHAIRTLAMNAPKPTSRIFTDAARRDVASLLKRYDPAFQVKDLRTAVALSEAAKAVARLKAKPPKDQRSAILAIGKAVSQRLGNTPDVAIRDYIGPTFLEDALLKLGYTAKAEDHPLLRALFGSAQVDAWLAAYVDESEEDDIEKAAPMRDYREGRGFPIGTVRVWADGRHYRKMAADRWEPVASQAKPKGSISEETEQWLQEWVWESAKTTYTSVPPRVIAELAPYRPTKPVQVYRWTKDDDSTERRKFLRSYTHQRGMVEFMQETGEQDGDPGRILVETIPPERILVDFTMLPKRLKDRHLDEVLTVWHPLDGMSKAWPPKKAGSGPFIGPKGGKWADPQHTTSWKPAVPGATGVIAAKDPHGITHYDPATGKKRKKGGSMAPIDIEHYDWTLGADDDTPRWRGRPLDAPARDVAASLVRDLGSHSDRPMPDPMPARPGATLESLTDAPVGTLAVTSDSAVAYRKMSQPKGWVRQRPHAGGDGWVPATADHRRDFLDLTKQMRSEAFHLRHPTVTKAIIPALVIDLEKAVTPPGKGWERIPKGKKGGFRRHTGKQGRAYEYFYPGQPSIQAKHGWEPDPTKGPKNAKAGDIVFVVGSHELYRLTPEHGPTETGRTWVHSFTSGKYTAIFKDKLRPARRRTQPQSAPPKTPTKPGKLPPPPLPPPPTIKPPKPEFTKPPTAKHSKPFKDTQQKPGTVLHRIESGAYLLQRHWDADRKKSHWGIYVPPGDERQFFDEMKPIIFGAAKKIGRRYGIQMKQADGSKTIAAENLISASTMGVVMSLSSYTGGRPFAPGAWGYALSYAGNQARTEMGAGANITVRQMRMLKGFLAAKMRQGAKLGRDPTPDEIAADWTVIKKDVYQGRLGSYTKDGTKHHQDRQRVPADDWQVLDAKGNPTGKSLPGTKKLAIQMAELAQGNKVEDSEWAGFRTEAMEQDFGHLPLGEASARRDRVDAILGAVARTNDQWAQALMMKFGLDDPGGTPATGTEIADALQILPGKPEPSRRKAVGSLLNAALASFQHEAKRQEAGDIASAASRWVKAPDAAPPSTPEHPTGRSWTDIVESVGPERAAILSAGIRGGRADWAEDILARERDGKATADESRDVRIFRAETERREAIAAFQAHAQTWSPEPGETRDVNPQGDVLTFRRVGGEAGTADFPPVGPHGPQGPVQVPVPGSPRYEPAEADVGGKKPPIAKEPHVAFVGDPEIHRMRYLQALYQIERSIPGARTPEQVQRILGRGPQPRQAGRREHPPKRGKGKQVAKAAIPAAQFTRSVT